MSSENIDRLQELFLAACDLDVSAQAAFLDRHCGDDPGLREQVEELLAGDRADQRPTEKLVGDVSALSDAMHGALAADGLPRPFGEYTLLRVLGQGGAGAVYEAEQPAMRRRVALKVLAGVAVVSQAADRRFEREAWVAGRLSHPGIVRVFARGEVDQARFLTMELIDGGTLAGVIRHLRELGRDATLGFDRDSRDHVEWAVAQIIAVARALHHAHQQGVVHRDIKPMNLLYDTVSRRLKIADFGVAIDTQETRHTQDGHVIGTLQYMSPEQLRGEKHAIDRRSDIYALAVTLFELITLELPYRGETIEGYLQNVLHGQPKQPRRLSSQVGRDLEVVLAKAMARDPKDRYATADDFADDLDRILHLRPIVARPPTTLDRWSKWARRRPAAAGLVAVSLVLAPTLIGLSWMLVESNRARRAEALHQIQDQIVRIDRHDPDRLIRLAERWLELDPGNADAMYSRGLGYYNLSLSLDDGGARRESLESAIADLDRSIESRETSSAYLLRAATHERLGSVDQAAADRERASALPVDPYHMGRQAAAEGRLDRAESFFSQCADEREDCLERRALVRLSLGKRTEAREDLRVLARMNRADPWPRQELAKLAVADADFTAASQYLDEAEPGEGEEADLQQVRSMVELEWGTSLAGRDDELALEHFRAAETAARADLAARGAISTSEPMDFAPSRLNLGAALVEQYQRSAAPDPAWLREALDLYSQVGAIELREGHPKYWMVARAPMLECDLLIVMERLDQAEARCREAVKRNPDDAVAHYNMASLYALTDRPDAALDALREDLGLGDTDYGYLESDKRFASLRGSEGFDEILDEMRRRSGESH